MSLYPFVGLLLIIVTMVNGGAKVCPGYGFIRPPEDCHSTCSTDNDQCPTGKKCCFRIEEPCGFQCIVPKDNEPKKGICPSPSSSGTDANWYLCDGHMCDIDNDCPGVQKCCLNLCGSPVCVVPK